ncbi:MAG: hypothetical protein AVDCRST_MAG05-5226 [uncultured Rubrobacteraceae bacterium]|uniref:DUF4279 domain-containing protein n=1 Tax=uncultured Rubrobacteraceae bacterium TaxID=349277 RepID=A0A6J4U5P8_9ACTN|nr:MAG: hypothetical protein AVDCRST_MAG05-5226 [uncultured Rubrobacteraceae bacterium]
MQSTLSRESTLDEHVADLLGRLAPHVDEIRALSGEHVVTFACVIYADSEEDYAQQVIVSGEQVDLISAMGANFWADVYFVAGD